MSVLEFVDVEALLIELVKAHKAGGVDGSLVKHVIAFLRTHRHQHPEKSFDFVKGLIGH